MGFFGLEINRESPARGRLARRSTSGGNQYSIIRKIGEGGQGTTEICERHSDGKILVRKEQSNFAMHGDIPREMRIFEEFLSPHPSIVDFDHATYVKKSDSLILYFEHCKGGDLSRWIPKSTLLPEDFIWHVFIQLADALAFLHYGISRRHPDSRPSGWRRIVHRDLKPANVFLRRRIASPNSKPDVVLGDFGLATTEESSYGCGTDQWVGPERAITKQGDVWGLGSIIHALAHGEGPVDPPPPGWISSEWYWSPQARNPRRMPRTYSDKLNQNVMDCLVRDPMRRVTSQELLRNLEADIPRHLR